MSSSPKLTFDLVQTFYTDPDRFNRSGEITLTSVDLFFKNKPDRNGRTSSGRADPGVTVYIVKTIDDRPDLRNIFNESRSRVTNKNIVAFSDGSGATSFRFRKPVRLKTGETYGVGVIFEDPGFELWESIAGEKIVGTATTGSGTNQIKDGKLYKFNYDPDTQFMSERADRDLVMKLYAAKYTANTTTATYVNPKYEFFSTSSINGRFKAGEYVYQAVANASGNVVFTAGNKYITADDADFSSGVVAGDKLVLFSNTSYSQVVEVLNVVNSSYIETTSNIVHSNTTTNWMIPPIGRAYNINKARNRLYLINSNANSSLKFAANSNILYGEDSQANAVVSAIDTVSVDRVRVAADVATDSRSNIDFDLTFARANTGGGYDLDLARQRRVQFNRFDTTRFNAYDARLVSRSLEVDQAGLFRSAATLDDGTTYPIDRVSAIANVSVTINEANTELYRSPSIPSTVDVYSHTADISNTYTSTDANSVTFDTEVNGPNLARSRHIGKKVTFANNRFSEDVRVFMTAYKPANTDVLVYARVHNSADEDAFDDRAWTPLEYKENADKVSSTEDENDFIEFELGLPQYSESANVLPGTFTTVNASVVITGAGVDPTSYVANNDLIKIYNPLVPEDYIVATVVDQNTTTISVGTAITNNNILGSGFKVDRLKYYNTAFNNITNDNVARYYNSSMIEFDKFDSMQIKIVMLSDTTYVTPRIDQIQVIGVSA